MSKQNKQTVADGQIIALLNKIKQEKAAIEKAERPDWKTNACFAYIDGSSQIINIKTISNVGDLIQIGAFLLEREKAFRTAIEQLDVVDAPSFTWCGFSLNSWISDLKARIAKIQISAKKAKLEALEERASAIVSPELRRLMELEAIQKELAT